MKKIFSLFLSVILTFFLTSNTCAYKIDDLGTVLFVGDSYCMGANIDNNGGEHQEQGWARLAAEKLGMTNYALACGGGTGLYHKSEGGKDYLSLIQEYVENNLDAASIRLVIIFAGYNDQWHTYDEIMIRGEETINYILQNFPNAKVALGMVGWHNSNQEYQLQLANISSQAYRDLADYMNIDYLEGSETVLVDKENVFSDDGFHPNLAGQELMASFISDYLSSELEKQYSTDLTPEPIIKDINKRFPIYLVIIAGTIIMLIIIVRKRIKH